MRVFRVGATAAVLTMLVFSGGATAAGRHAAANSEPEFVPGELVVRFEAGASAGARTAALASQGAKVQQNLSLPGLRLVKLPPGKDVHAAAAALNARPEVKYAEPNWIYYAAATTPNDPRFPQQWGLNQANDQDIDAPEAWDITQGTHSTVVAVVDTGVAYDHNDLAPNMWSNPGETMDGLDNDGNGKVDDVRGWDFFDDDNDPFDTEGHGTHVAGIIGARGNNAIGVAGVNWDVTIMPVRVAGPGWTTAARVTSGFAYAVAEGAKVVTASWACAAEGKCNSQAMKDVIDGAPETLFVVPAGNWGYDADSAPVYPCAYTSANLICVAAVTRADYSDLAPFSDYGTTSVDLGAPGAAITSTWLGYDTLFSDSFESPTLTPVWTSGGTNNTWATSTELSTGGARSATDSGAYQYANNTDSWIRTSAATSFAGHAGCQVVYFVALDVYWPSDSVEVEGATSPAGPWTSVDSLHTSTGRRFAVHESDMSTFDGQPSVYLRFRLHTDATLESDGVWLDQVKIRCATRTYDADDYNTIDGTSMAAAHVAGVAGLIFAKNPTATVAEARAALLETGDPLSSLADKTVTGRRVNAFNALSHVSRFCGGKYATIVGTEAGETLTGTPGDDVIMGLGGNDTIDGGGGNDRICGGPGNDILRGRLGNDVIAGDNGTDTLDYSLAPSAVVTNMVSHGSSGGDGVDSFTGMENWTGSAFNDTLVADNGSNVINGGDGNDTLRGGLGDDTMNGGNGIDLADYNGSEAGVSVSLTVGAAWDGAGHDSLAFFEGVVGSPFADTLTGDDGPNGLTGGAGTDTLWGGLGADRLRGGPDADVMHGEAGTDTLDFTTAPAGVTASLLGGTASGGAGADTFDGMEYVLGSPFGDSITGSNVHNRLDGLGGNDSLFGLAGDDVLWGGIGTDNLDGGADTDKCLEGEVLTRCEL